MDEDREDFHFEPRDKPPVELGFVNEHVRFSDEESDHDDDRLVIATLLSLCLAIKFLIPQF